MRFFALIALCLMALLASLTVAQSDEDFCACPRHLDYVCGSDSITYPNPCELACASKRFARQGRSLTQAKRGKC